MKIPEAILKLFQLFVIGLLFRKAQSLAMQPVGKWNMKQKTETWGPQNFIEIAHGPTGHL